MSTPDDPALEDIVREFVRAGCARVHTACPATVIAYNPVLQSATVQLSIRQRRSDPTLDIERPALLPTPPIPNVPVVWPSGSQVVGGWSVHGPLVPGDPVTVIFAERGTDEWRTTGAPDNIPLHARRHSYIDAIAIPGGRAFNPAAVPTAPLGVTAADPTALVFSVSLPTTLKLGGGLAVDAVIKGTTFVAALSTWLSALSTWLSATVVFATAAYALGVPPAGIVQVTAWVVAVQTAAGVWSTATSTLLTATGTFAAALTPSLSVKTFTE